MREDEGGRVEARTATAGVSSAARIAPRAIEPAPPPRLAFWTLAPPVLIAISVFFLWAATRLKIRSAGRDSALLPTTLRVLFLTYSIVTNYAFHAGIHLDKQNA